MNHPRTSLAHHSRPLVVLVPRPKCLVAIFECRAVYLNHRFLKSQNCIHTETMPRYPWINGPPWHVSEFWESLWYHSKISIPKHLLDSHVHHAFRGTGVLLYDLVLLSSFWMLLRLHAIKPCDDRKILFFFCFSCFHLSLVSNTCCSWSSLPFRYTHCEVDLWFRQFHTFFFSMNCAFSQTILSSINPMILLHVKGRVHSPYFSACQSWFPCLFRLSLSFLIICVLSLLLF